MASLELNLDGTFGDDDGKMGESCHQYKDDKEYQILKEFLQLDSHTPLEAAVNSLLELIPDHGSSGSVQSNIDLCAGVIPWHHPSHLKLAYLAERLRWSPKMSPQLGNIKSAKDSYLLNVSFSDGHWDEYETASLFDPEIQYELDLWMNYNVHLANLSALNFWGYGESPFVYRTMAYAFKHLPKDFGCDDYRDPKDEVTGPRGRDATVIAAAQWILWDGQKVRRHAIYPRRPLGAGFSSEGYFNLERTGTSTDRWQLWKQGFKSASEEEGASKECRDVALRAYRLMDVLENTMPS